ncbi:MAG: hypothetical protein AB1714_27025 [Acidobacteriota bacterium]
MPEEIENKDATGTTKEAYEPPEIRRIRLAADEMASAGCKAVLVAPGVCRRDGLLINIALGS